MIDQHLLKCKRIAGALLSRLLRVEEMDKMDIVSELLDRNIDHAALGIFNHLVCTLHVV